MTFLALTLFVALLIGLWWVTGFDREVGRRLAYRGLAWMVVVLAVAVTRPL